MPAGGIDVEVTSNQRPAGGFRWNHGGFRDLRMGFNRSSLRRFASEPAVISVLLGLVITVATWSPPVSLPPPELDPSWQAGLAMALTHHIPFGHGVVFTYGPLGSAVYPFLFGGRTIALAFVFALAVHWAIAGILVHFLRRSYGLLGSFAISWVVVALAADLVDGGDLPLSLGLLLALIALRTEPSWAHTGALVALAIGAALQSLVKSSGGVVLAVILVVVLLSTRRPKTDIAAGAIPFVVVFFATWFATGQDLRYLTDYARGSISVILGYSSAMSISQGRQVEVIYGAILVGFLLILAVVCLVGRPRREWVATSTVVLIWTWLVVKEGFVRHDAHDLYFFGLVLIALAFWRPPLRARTGHLCMLAVAAAFALIAGGGVPQNLLAPVSRSESFAHEIDVIANGSLRSRQITEYRRALSTSGPYSLTPKLLDELTGDTVAIEPTANMIAWIYPQLRWDPEPVLQEYSAYTTYLDDLDTNFLRSTSAPQRILYSVSTIDGRDPWFDPPSTQVARLCRYQELTTDGSWQVLARVKDRCSRPVRIGQVTSTFGESITVPRGDAHDMVLMTVTANQPVLSGVQGLVLKPPPTFATVIGSGYSAKYRWVPGTAGDLHVLRTPSDLGYSPAFTPASVDKVVFSGGGWSPGQGRVVVTFYRVTMNS